MDSSFANLVIVNFFWHSSNDYLKSNTFIHILRLVALLNLLKGRIWFSVGKFIHFAIGQ